MFSNHEKNQKISFRFQKKISISNRAAVKNTIIALFKKEKQTLESLDIILCSDEYLLDINKANLNHDYYTDTITFNYTPKNQKEILGEIYISVDRVRDNAKKYNTTIKQELLRVVFHSSLHLCGYKDKSATQKKQMTAKEDYFIGLYDKYVSRGT
jgi:probable rRNA maturation factor